MQVNWTCPHCGKPQVVTDATYSESIHFLNVSKLDVGSVALKTWAISCLNQECKKLTLHATLQDWVSRNNGQIHWDIGKSTLQFWKLLPESTAIPQPDFIPKALRDDYYEACKIRDLSPKASATLSRRCLQGMIRDFCKIAKGTLDGEIKSLRSAVDDGHAPSGVTPESIDAIDHVRSIGNIGAHMEKDINLIVEVDAGEAEVLTDLIEMLFKEWYVSRHERQQKLAQLKAIAEDKKAKIAAGRAESAKAQPDSKAP